MVTFPGTFSTPAVTRLAFFNHLRLHGLNIQKGSNAKTKQHRASP